MGAFFIWLEKAVNHTKMQRSIQTQKVEVIEYGRRNQNKRGRNHRKQRN